MSPGRSLAAARAADLSVRGLAESLARLAYEEPDYTSAKVHARAITNFANHCEIECFDATAAAPADVAAPRPSVTSPAGCTGFFAGTVALDRMGARQRGVSFEEYNRRWAGLEPDAERRLGEATTRLAYMEPIQASAEAKERATVEFGGRMKADCNRTLADTQRDEVAPVRTPPAPRHPATAGPLSRLTDGSRPSPERKAGGVEQ